MRIEKLYEKCDCCGKEKHDIILEKKWLVRLRGYKILSAWWYWGSYTVRDKDGEVECYEDMWECPDCIQKDDEEYRKFRDEVKRREKIILFKNAKQKDI